MGGKEAVGHFLYFLTIVLLLFFTGHRIRDHLRLQTARRQLVQGRLSPSTTRLSRVRWGAGIQLKHRHLPLLHQPNDAKSVRGFIPKDLHSYEARITNLVGK